MSAWDEAGGEASGGPEARVEVAEVAIPGKPAAWAWQSSCFSWVITSNLEARANKIVLLFHRMRQPGNSTFGQQSD